MQSSKDEIRLTSFEESVDNNIPILSSNKRRMVLLILMQVSERILSRMETSSINADPVNWNQQGIIELDRVTTGGQPGRTYHYCSSSSNG